jgi:signal transduction histidine kinase
MLRELLFNLVDNAIKHMGEPGSVNIFLLRQQSDIIMRVTDTGPGIVPEDRLKVFERFVRLDEARPGSSGLGLAIVKEICNLLGASVTLDTPASGRGLQVDIRFPQKLSNTTTETI